MGSLLSRNFLSAALIIGVGVFACLNSVLNYSIGAVSSPGPGLFPAIVGGLMVLSGTFVGVQALLARSREEGAPFEGRPLFFILLSIAAFAAMVETTGYAPAVFVLVFLASFGDRSLTLKSKLLLATSLMVLSVVMFTLVLQVSLPVLFRIW